MRLVVGWVLLAVLVGGCGEGGKTEAVQPADKNKPAGEANHAPEVRAQIVVEEVQLKPLAGDLSLPGKVQYSEDRYAKVSSPLVGRVVEVRAKLGDKVAAGQVLLSLESADLGAAYSDFVKAESDFQLSKRNYELAKDLYESKAMSKKDLVQLENAFLEAQAEFRRTRERLLALRVPAEELDKPRTERLITSRFDLKSPLAGTVVERNVTVGQMVGADPTQVLYTIADLNELQVVAAVYERDLSRVSKGAAAGREREDVGRDHSNPGRPPVQGACGRQRGATPQGRDGKRVIARIVEFSISQRLFVLTLGMVLLFGGLYAFHILDVVAYPDPSPPMVEVITQNPGWSAEEIERLITIPLETALNGMPGLTDLRSISIFGLSDIKAYFDFKTDYYFDRQEVLNRLQLVNLPAGVQP